MTVDEMLKIYFSKMCQVPFEPDGKYAVRVWDGMDGCWCDVVAGVDLKTALETWCDRTKNGTEHTNYSDIDYYRIFPADTKMLWSWDNTMRGED